MSLHNMATCIKMKLSHNRKNNNTLTDDLNRCTKNISDVKTNLP